MDETNTFNILMVEDNEGDVILTQEIIEDLNLDIKLHIAKDGQDGLDFLNKEVGYEDSPNPDLILLDLNMPRINGKEFLRIVKNDKTLEHIPVTVLSTSDADKDINASYQLKANCYLVKPFQFSRYNELMNAVLNFWFRWGKLPKQNNE